MNDRITLTRRWIIGDVRYESNIDIMPQFMPRSDRDRLRRYLDYIRSRLDISVMKSISENQGENSVKLFPRMIREGGEFLRDVVDDGDTLEFLVQPKNWQENVTDMFVAVHDARTGYGQAMPWVSLQVLPGTE